jgi:hypothetical protein
LAQIQLRLSYLEVVLSLLFLIIIPVTNLKRIMTLKEVTKAWRQFYPIL